MSHVDFRATRRPAEDEICVTKRAGRQRIFLRESSPIEISINREEEKIKAFLARINAGATMCRRETFFVLENKTKTLNKGGTLKAEKAAIN